MHTTNHPLTPKPGEAEDFLRATKIANRISSMDYKAYDRLTDELGKEQMIIVLFVGYHGTGKLTMQQVGEFVVALATCWLFYREQYGRAAFPPLDAPGYAGKQRQQLALWEKHLKGSPAQSDQAMDDYLRGYEPRGLLTWLLQTLLIASSAELRQVSKEIRQQVFFDSLALVACWQEQVTK